jgi:hypothetical protein
MHISSDQGLSSILREGDYFVVSSGSGGLSVEFSADGPANGPVIGAFASMKGHVLLWKAAEAAEILESRGEDAENFLIRDIRRQIEKGRGARARPGAEPKEKLPEKLARLMRAFAQEYPSDTGAAIYRGWLPDFHKEVVNAIYPGPLDVATKKAIVKLEELLPGFHVTQQGRGPRWTWIMADWSTIAGEAGD